MDFLCCDVHTLKPLRVATNQIDLTFQSLIVVELSSPLLLVHWVQTNLYKLHLYTYILLVKFYFFSYDLLLLSIAKPFLFYFDYFKELLTLVPFLSIMEYRILSAWCGHVLRATSFCWVRPEVGYIFMGLP